MAECRPITSEHLVPAARSIMHEPVSEQQNACLSEATDFAIISMRMKVGVAVLTLTAYLRLTKSSSARMMPTILRFTVM